MGTEEKAAAKRIGRGVVAVVVEEITRVATGSPYAIAIIPILSGLGKWLRAKFNWSWLPF